MLLADAFRKIGAGSDHFAATINGAPTRNPVTFRPHGFAQGYNTPDVALGTHTLEAGEHQLILTNTGDETRSIGVESLRLLKLPTPAVREVKTHNEAHYPFTSQCDGVEFRVTSTAPSGWTHSWRGLDARR